MTPPTPAPPRPTLAELRFDSALEAAAFFTAGHGYVPRWCAYVTLTEEGRRQARDILPWLPTHLLWWKP